MRPKYPRGRSLGLLALAALLLWPAVASAQPAQQPVSISAEGTDLFRALLSHAKIKPVKRNEAFNLGPGDDVIVIAFGPPTAHNIDFFNPADEAKKASNRGGAGFVASDTPALLGSAWRQDPQTGWREYRCDILAARVECGDANATLREFEDCPFVVPLTRNENRDAPPDDSPAARVFKGLTRVATNEPSMIIASGYTGEFSHPLAAFPRGSTWTDQFDRTFRLPPNAAFAVGSAGTGVNRSGRYLAFADHSLFTNQMMIEQDTQNLELAYRVVEFLRGPDQRSRCLFIENGRVVETFDDLQKAFAQSKPKPPLPNIDMDKIQQKLVDMGNTLIDRVQTNDVPNRTLLRAFGLPSIIRFVLIVLAIYATWYLLRRTFSARKPIDVPAPPAVAGVPTGPPGVFDRRQKELLRRDNLYEPVRDLVREFFASVGVHGEPGPKPPKLVISDAVRKPESLKLAIKDFWKVAYGEPQDVTVNRWRELEPYFERLKQAHADGKWHFVLADSPVAAG